MAKKLSKEELANVQELQRKFLDVKIGLADSLIRQRELFKNLDSVQGDFQSVEVELTKVYGENAVINLQTGDVTDPPKEEAPLKKEE
tara:strand:- start:2352 stop:2612 length:261 start_codon:yes stop_codon:yes gene_type:complete